MTTNLLERPSVGRTWDPRLAGVLALGLVFLVGAVVGAAVMNSSIHTRLHQPAFDTQQGRALNFEKLQKDLALTPSQADQVQSILNDMWQYYRTVLSDSKSRVEQVLTPEQRDKFERLLQQQR